MTRYLYSPIYPISSQLATSHRSGWAQYWAQELGATLLTGAQHDQLQTVSKSDVVFTYHGMEFNDSLNLQSGLSPTLYQNVQLLLKLKRELKLNLVSIDRPMPDYPGLLAPRVAKEGDAAWRALDLAPWPKSSWVQFPTTEPVELIVGDSHALSMYRPGARILRHDGKTLHGALSDGWLKEQVDQHTAPSVKKLTVYFGNIDIRHHLCRLDNHRAGVDELVRRLDIVLKQIKRQHTRLKIEVVTPLPIESEDRVLPKTGWYKGTPFYGSWEKRMAVRDVLTQALANLDWKFYRHPEKFWNEQGQLTYNVMELPRSVHIRPSEYRLHQPGGLK